MAISFANVCSLRRGTTVFSFYLQTQTIYDNNYDLGCVVSRTLLFLVYLILNLVKT